MNREELIEYIQKTYAVIPDYLWNKYPNYAVFRHHNNSKWFAVIMDVAENKLFDSGKNRKVDIINLKLPAPLVGALRLKKAVYPAYHMNKEHWVSICLDANFDDMELKSLISESYELTQ